jgi:uncharacterized membrane protein YczE
LESEPRCVGNVANAPWERIWAQGKAWMVLVVGLFLFAFSIVLQVKSDLGLGPWDVFHVGAARVSGLSLGQVSIITGLVVIMLAYLVARVKPGPGTIANMILIGLFVDWTYGFVPTMTELPWKIGLFVSGLLLMGLATAVYIGAGLGAGPRDSLMLGLHRVTGLSVRVTRTFIEASVFAVGVLLGGKFGLGTVLFVAGIGAVVQLFLALLKVETHS